MTPPEIDLTQPDAVRRELLDDDRAVKDEFARHLDGELNELAEVLPACFRLHFDEAKLEAYRAELEGRINLCHVLPPFMGHMIATMTPPAPHGEPA